MARNDDSQRGSDTPPRVYKSSDVHKRRVDRKGRAKESVKPIASPAPGEEAVAPEQPEADVEPAVVISPEFGKRADAQRKADERWFAAMRKGDLSDPTQSAEAAAASEAPVAETPPESDVSVPDEEQAPSAPADVEPPAPSAAIEEAPPAPSTQADETPSAPDAEDADAQADLKRQSAIRRLIGRLPKKGPLRIAAIVIPIILIVAIVAALLFAWNRWYRFDDHVDMQGTWYVVGTEVPIEIDEASIKLTEDVTYQYEIETHDKTIRFTFGPMEGQGRYWLSDDRQYLVITDGDNFDGTSTALDDLLHTLTDMGDKVTGEGIRLPEGDGIIALSRKPFRGTFSEQVVKALAEKKAAEEARKEAERKAAEEAAEAEYYDYYYYEEDYTEEESASEEPAPEEEPQEDSSGEEYDGEEG